MATRPLEDLKLACIKSYTVGTACTAGYAVKLSADGTITNCGAGDSGMGVALETKATGLRAQIVLLAGACIIKVKVGTGDATRNTWAKMAADGFTDAALGGGTTTVEVLGMFLQSGVAGDEVGLLPAPHSAVT
jgi:hypothetical protein